jgi:hypothetical protein
MAAAAIRQAHQLGACGHIMLRADSAYCTARLVTTALRHHAWYSITARMDPGVTKAIAAIPEQAWTPIRYPHAIWDETTGTWISDAQVAETWYTAFTSTRTPVQTRLIIRRVKELHPTSQDPLIQAWRYHGFITNSDLPKVPADEQHRCHAIIEHVIEELKNGPLAHLPSGKYAANAAWAVLTVIAHNLTRAVACAAKTPWARTATIRRIIINLAGRIATSGRRLVVHLPEQWPWAGQWDDLAKAASPPKP